MSSPTQLLESINKGLSNIAGRLDEIETRQKKMESGEWSEAESAAFTERVKKSVDEVVALQRKYNTEIGNATDPGTRQVDPATGNLMPEWERQMSTRGRLFGKYGQNTVPYAKMVGDLSANNRWVKNKGQADVDLLVDLQDTHDAVALIKAHIWRKFKDEPESVRYAKLLKHPDFQEHMRLRVAAGYLDPKHMKANEFHNPSDLTSLDFTFLSGQLFMYREAGSDIDQEFQNFTLPRRRFDINIQTNHAEGVLAGGTSGSGATYPPVQDPTDGVFPAPPNAMFSKLAFSLVSFTAKYNMTVLPFNDQMEEDSLIPWLPKMREEALIGWRRATNRALVDGDDTATHMDEVGAGVRVLTPNYRKAFKGLRKLSVTNHTVGFGNAAITTANLDSMIRKMGTFSDDPSENIFIMSSVQLAQTVMLAAVSEFQTWGPGNSYPTGTVGGYRGRRIRVSPFLREDLNASGLYDNVTTNRGVFHLVNPTRFYRGQMRNVIAESWRIPPGLVTYITAHNREDFKAADRQLLDGANGVFAAGIKPPVVTGINTLIT